MHLPISKRLLACAEFIKSGDVVADVGCDHGYLGIHLLKTGIAARIFACDINEGPLQSAFHNAHKYGVADRMSFYLSPGVIHVPRDFTAMVCAGMGGDTMISILEDAPWLKDSRYRLILQCQSKTPLLRRYLSDNGWYIAGESVLRDGRFLYTVMEVLYDPKVPRLTVGQQHFSPALQENNSAEAKEYLIRITDGLRLSLSHREDPEKRLALEELEKLL